ncbi:maltokinase N-terminal cap-like domain-containing protein [Streptomyces sp. NBC_01465]|uniref:maltokinase N-terminal cap-like domain-containing protein n=1 Tax=Streptomyces sp. NBC_01465 TaxID=2903878 RepID=UPI002E34A623|nr:phosphotransferase [Streptomyces sp. NBC_01465]
MSKAASIWTASIWSDADADARASSVPPDPLISLAPMLRQWLPRQRWFAGKGRSVDDLTLVSATGLLPPGGSAGLLHLLIRTEPDGDCYQLLLGLRAALPRHLASALIGHVTEGPLTGLTAYDALLDPRLAGLLLERLRTPGTLGTLRFDRDPRATLPAPGLNARPLGAEQSNSSLVYGDAYILKLFRRIHAGTNPDLELPWALARSGCHRVPAPVAWFEGTLDGEPATLGVLQPFLRGSDDGWQLALHALADGRDFRTEAYELGRTTAEIHAALATALPTQTLRKQQTDHLAADMIGRLQETAQAVPSLLPYVPGLRTAFEQITSLGQSGRTWQAQRVHGDLHLGQALRARSGHAWSLIDFEGEPARPLTERTRPQPIARDVAGMLRSFDYAARSHRPWDPDWAAGCRSAYCEGYAALSGNDPRAEPELLRAYETDKAVYEVLYEARHRPDWLPVPMAAIQRLAADPPPSRRPPQ